MPTVNSRTVFLEIFAVVNNSRLKETAKILHSKIEFEPNLTTANMYLRPLQTANNRLKLNLNARK